jgi:hypothetical protein
MEGLLKQIEELKQRMELLEQILTLKQKIKNLEDEIYGLTKVYPEPYYPIVVPYIPKFPPDIRIGWSSDANNWHDPNSTWNPSNN